MEDCMIDEPLSMWPSLPDREEYEDDDFDGDDDTCPDCGGGF